MVWGCHPTPRAGLLALHPGSAVRSTPPQARVAHLLCRTRRQTHEGGARCCGVATPPPAQGCSPCTPGAQCAPPRQRRPLGTFAIGTARHIQHAQQGCADRASLPGPLGASPQAPDKIGFALRRSGGSGALSVLPWPTVPLVFQTVPTRAKKC